jgi:transcriptional regulator with XRE-family HTH domain
MAKQADPIDIYVGKRLRLRRTLLGFSQEKLGNLLGLTFQQVQKYERGANRIGSSRLYKIATVLSVPVSYFFEGFEEGECAAPTPAVGALNETTVSFTGEPFDRRETLELVRAYYRIEDPLVRRRVLELVRALGAERRDPPDGAEGTTDL